MRLLPLNKTRIILLFVDLTITVASLYIAFLIRFDNNVPESIQIIFFQQLVPLIIFVRVLYRPVEIFQHTRHHQNCLCSFYKLSCLPFYTRCNGPGQSLNLNSHTLNSTDYRFFISGSNVEWYTPVLANMV